MKRLLFNNIDKKKQYFYCIVTILVISAICFALTEFIGYHVVALILLLTVSILAITFQLLPVLVSAALSALIWDYFFIPPRFTIHVNSTEDTILLIMYFVIAMINGVLTFKIRAVEKVLRVEEERANSVKLYNTILDSLSHELRTPISAIIGATDNLQFNKLLNDNDRKQLIAEISKASLRLNQQVDNLLNISRLESGHIKPKSEWTDIVELIYEVVKEVEDKNPGRYVSLNVHPELPMCKLDRGMLYQVLYNLINNAAIHTDSHSRIFVLATCHADILQLTIEDGGPDFMKSGIIEKFDKFSRSKSLTNTGSGLGLSIVKGFTEALGGTVGLENSLLGGAKFTVALPVETNSFKTVNEARNINN